MKRLICLPHPRTSHSLKISSMVLVLLLGTLLSGCAGLGSFNPATRQTFARQSSPTMRKILEERRGAIAEIVKSGFVFERKKLRWLPGARVRVPDQPCPDCRNRQHTECSVDYPWMPNRWECTCRSPHHR